MLKPYNIIFHKGKTPIARFIRWLTKSNYSHCAIVLNGDGYHMLTLDWKTPTTIEHLRYPIGNYDVYEVTTFLSYEDEETIMKFIRKHLSKSYDFKFIFSRFFNILFGTPIYVSEGKFNCDNLIVEAFRSTGINLVNSDKMLSPDELSKSKLLRKIEEVN